jgi:hypothetical protein
MPARSVAYGTRLSVVCFTLGGLTAAAQSPGQPDCPRGTLPAYAHNDYINTRPLHDALSLGYKGVEADVFLVEGVLRLGHDRKAAARGAAFEAQYLAPLRSLVARCGTLTADARGFLLNVELKEQSPSTFDTLVVLLARYADLFTSRGGNADSGGPRSAPAVQVVLVGWSPPALADDTLVPMGRQARLRHADGRALEVTDPSVRLISLDYGKTMGRWWMTPGHRRRWLGTIRATRAAFPTQRIRAYDVPVNERVYRDLLGAGVDFIGTMHLERTARVLGAFRDP